MPSVKIWLVNIYGIGKIKIHYRACGLWNMDFHFTPFGIFIAEIIRVHWENLSPFYSCLFLKAHFHTFRIFTDMCKYCSSANKNKLQVSCRKGFLYFLWSQWFGGRLDYWRLKLSFPLYKIKPQRIWNQWFICFSFIFFIVCLLISISDFSSANNNLD